MTDPIAATEQFQAMRGRLFGLAYRMVGSRADAEDLVQEAYLRWHKAEHDRIESAEAWLVTTTTRLALDRLRRLKTERDAYTGPWLPEPIVGPMSTSAPDQHLDLADDLSMASLTLLERLAPEERAAFLLHDVFESDYDEISAVLGKSEAACRQIVSRARRRVREERPRVQVSPAARERLVESFMRAIELRDRDALVALFAEEAALTSDGGGKAKAAQKVVRGGASVVRFRLGVLRVAHGHLELEKIVVNGETGLALRVAGQLVSVMSFVTDGRQILGVYSVLNPDKLRGVPSAHEH